MLMDSTQIVRQIVSQAGRGGAELCALPGVLASQQLQGSAAQDLTKYLLLE